MALATKTSPGEIQLAGDLAGNNDATAPELTSLGITSGQYTYSKVTVDAKGRITAIAAGDPAEFSALLIPASNVDRGVVQAGTGLSVTANAAAGYQTITFSTSIDGSEAAGLNTCASYLLDIQIDFGSTQNIVLPGSGFTNINSVINDINTQLVGAVVSIVSGKIRITSNTTGSSSIVEIINDGIFSCISGYVSVDAFIIGVSDCTMNADLATISQHGIVQVGSGLSIDGAGVLSTVIASPTTLGTVSVGSGLSIDGSGVLSGDVVPDATTTSKGVVQIGDGISVSAGIISTIPATNIDKGVVKSANTNNITITNGSVNIGPDVALLNVSNNWTTAQIVTPSVLTSATNVSVNATLSNIFNLTLDQNATLDAPTNLASGGRYTFIVEQPSTGSPLGYYTLTFASVYKFKNGSDKTLTTSIGAIDIITCVSDGTDLYCSLAKGFA